MLKSLFSAIFSVISGNARRSHDFGRRSSLPTYIAVPKYEVLRTSTNSLGTEYFVRADRYATFKVARTCRNPPVSATRFF